MHGLNYIEGVHTAIPTPALLPHPEISMYTIINIFNLRNKILQSQKPPESRKS